MFRIILLLVVFLSPLFASSDFESNQEAEELKTFFGSDLITIDLEEAGLDWDEAYELVKLGLKTRNPDVPAAKNTVPRMPVLDTELPQEWEYFFETQSHRPLIICPREKGEVDSFLLIAEENQSEIIAAIKKYGAIVFSGFDFTIEEFPKVFKAATGVSPEEYEGDTPRERVAPQVYKSTAVAPAHHIGLHQEVAVLGIEGMPQFLSFYCELPPKAGTGRTLVASAREITESIRRDAPDLWELMNKELTSWAFYMPDTGFWTKVTKMLNPSHATITEKFGTDDPELIQKWCQDKKHTCSFVDGGVKLFHQPLPGVIQLDGESIFCNQIHLNVRNAHLCGGEFYKQIADLLLYEQFGIHLPDGTPITADQADRLSRVIKLHEDGRDWKAGDVMILDNLGSLHGKTSHVGERKVYAVMGGRANLAT